MSENKTSQNGEKALVPHTLGIIMDGNRRFAKNLGKHTSFGHSAGYEKLKDFLSWSKEVGISQVIIYAFSTENWKRAEEEVGYLKELFASTLFKRDFIKPDTRIIFIGDKNSFGESLAKEMNAIEIETADRAPFTVAIALSYGGRAEIISAVNSLIPKIVSGEISSIDEAVFSKALYTRDLTDPDMVIRTGGEVRLSNFLPWQSVYSELFFTKTLWPEFTREEFDLILQEFNARKRNWGK